MTPKGLGLAIVAAALAGAALTALVGAQRHDGQVRRWEAERDSLAGVQALQDRRMAEAERGERIAEAERRAIADSAGRLEVAYRALKGRRSRVDTLTLPDTGCVPVAIVRAAQQTWQHELAVADSQLVVAEHRHTADAALIASYDRSLVARTNELVAEHESRLYWQHLAKTAPVRERPRKLLGLIPLPALSAGVQAGVSTTGTPYLGVGVQVGWRISL